jgi:RIO kinase 2|tara:strand:+ start:1941 stop:2135 length:195 start_codon:yes stop_codon:yes gene_type:complete
MISTNHQNAEYYFDRDVECVRTFFRRRFGFVVERVPTLRSHVVRSETLDVELAASGWTQASRCE